MQELKVGKVIISKQGEDSENYKKFKQIVSEKKIKVVVVGANGKESNQSAVITITQNKKNVSENIIIPQRIDIEQDVYFDILWPNNEKLISENILNNNSIVCKLHYKDFSMLFTGDIEEIAEKQVLEEYKTLNMNVSTMVNTKASQPSNSGIEMSKNSILKATILKVGHHGSKTSSTQGFIEAVNPKIALIGVGEDNKFGHPNIGVIKRLEALRYKNM